MREVSIWGDESCGQEENCIELVGGIEAGLRCRGNGTRVIQIRTRRGDNYYVLTLEPSGAGNGWRSNNVILVSLKRGFLHRDHAVDSPKTPLPMIRIDEGI
jgi:hypothetical protein